MKPRNCGGSRPVLHAVHPEFGTYRLTMPCKTRSLVRWRIWLPRGNLNRRRRALPPTRSFNAIDRRRRRSATNKLHHQTSFDVCHLVSSTPRRRGSVLRSFSSVTGSIAENGSDHGPVATSYNHLVTSDQVMFDDEQHQLATKLDTLLANLQSTDRKVALSSDLHKLQQPPTDLPWQDRLPLQIQSQWYQSRQPTSPKGLYIYGSVGVGKSFLMDLFHSHCSENASNRGNRRLHFHEFMLDVHQRIHTFKQKHPRTSNALSAISVQLAREARILCLDEFQVTDICDAMILQQLFQNLWELGVVVVTTSNRAPSQLYQGGINRSRFLPFIDLLEAELEIIELTGSLDYRRQHELDSSEEIINYFYPSSDLSVQSKLDAIFFQAASDNCTSESTTSETISVQMGRSIHVPQRRGNTARMSFDDLCGQPLGAADYLALCDRFDCLIVEHVPQLTAQRFNEARRFVTLIDCVYEGRTRLILSSEVALQDLMMDFDQDIQVESIDGDEEIGISSESQVVGEGGSSSAHATTLIPTKDGEAVEWSATGRIGVSLAQLSSVQEVSFSFRRAESRLVEMLHQESWGQ